MAPDLGARMAQERVRDLLHAAEARHLARRATERPPRTAQRRREAVSWSS